MRFYTNQHAYYCGVDLHARNMYTCILDQSGEILLQDYFPQGSVRKTVEVEMELLTHYEQLLAEVEPYILQTAKVDDPKTLALLQTTPGWVGSCPWPCSMRSIPSSASPGSRTSCPTADWCGVSIAPTASPPVQPVGRWGTLI